MNHKPLLTLIDLMRGERHELRESVLLAAALLTWQQLSQMQRIPSELTLTAALASSPREAGKVLLALSDELQVAAFLEASAVLENTNLRTATELLEATLRTEQLGKLESYDPSDIATTMGGMRRGGLPYLPEEVCDLMIALALDGSSPEERVYLPWAEGGQLLGRCLKAGRVVAMETPVMTGQYISELIRAHLEYPIQSQFAWSDPIRAPHFQDKGILRKFDVTIANPPFGARINSGDLSNDSFDRFPERTNSLTVLAIRHILAQTKKRAVIALSNSVLFSSGGERRLRRDLLEEGVIQSVIALPSGLLADSNIPFSILVLDKNQRHHTVRFVNCDSEHFKVAESRARFKLKAIEDITSLALGHSHGTDAADENGKDLQRNEWNLLPSRYVLDAGKSRIDKVMEQYKTIRLEEIAEIIRPLAETEIIDPIEVLEIGAMDILGNGYIARPTKATSISGLPSRSGAQFVQPLDIVLVIKGSVGKLSIAPEDTPPPGPGGWVVGQSMAIVRLRTPDIDPKSLTVFLRSGIGQELLRRLTAGATIPFLQIRELRQLRVPVLGRSQSDEAIHVLQRQHELRLQMQQLQEELDTAQVVAWQNQGEAPSSGHEE